MKKAFETISVIGLGYIGLPTAAMFASFGMKVIGVDINQDVVDSINKGIAHISEPALEDIVSKTVSNGSLRATRFSEPADAFLIAVPTPFEDGEHVIKKPNLSYLFSAVDLIAPIIKKGDLIILESTSPVGTTEKLIHRLSKKRSDLIFPQETSIDSDINVAYCPERVLPGQIVRELVENDRVIGGISNECSRRATDLYKIFVRGNCPNQCKDS